MRFCSSSSRQATLFLAALVVALSAPLHGQTDPRAIEVADRALQAMGGQQAWDATRHLVFTFAVQERDEVLVERTHFWDKWEQRHRVQGRTGDGTRYVVIEDLQTRSGKVWLDGEPVEGALRDPWLERAWAMWTNDTYWLLMPYKLRDPGVNLSWEGEETIGETIYDKLHLSFDEVGLTPGDQYWGWFNRKTGLMDRWAFILEQQEPPSRVYEWRDWRPYGTIMLATDRIPAEGERAIVFRDLATPSSLPESVFTSLDAPTVTSLLIRATSRDAKIIGSGVGGARITVRDAGTGAILAEGLQSGGTGDTDAIVRNPHPRDGTIYDTRGAASFLATILLDEPTQVTIEAEGPLGHPQALGSATKTMLVVPGEDVRGEGIILEIHGFIVEILDTELRDGETTGEQLYVRVRLRMT